MQRDRVALILIRNLTRAVVIVALTMGFLFFSTALAQNNVRMIGGSPVAPPPGGSGQQPMMVTNAAYKLFDPEIEFEAKDAVAPVWITAREAWDYVFWAGKKMGVDFAWRPMPGNETGLGCLYILGKGFDVEPDKAAMQAPTPPANMVYVPQGPFIMGSNVGDADESPRHTAYTGAYFCDKYEVSNGEYKKVFPTFEFEAGRENYPVVVTWEQATAYAERVHKRLPSEAEWEKAARGMDGRTFPWGETFDPTFYCWDETYPRGGSQACPESPFGCIDMAGGVWEWIADWYKPYPMNDTPQEEYGEKYKVIRGGASFNDVAMLRTTHRYYLPLNTTGNLRAGFRCVQDVE